jgi:hypothetical protein
MLPLLGDLGALSERFGVLANLIERGFAEVSADRCP